MDCMMTKICAVAILSCLSVVACGGAVQPDDKSTGGTGDPKTTFSAPGAAPASISPYGAWDLISLDGQPGGKKTMQTFGHLFLELRPDGTAIARMCTKPYYEPGLVSLRCADSAAYDCVYGTIAVENGVYRVDLPDLRASTKEARGEIVADEKADANIVVRYILPQYSAGHFTRVTAGDSPTSACKGP